MKKIAFVHCWILPGGALNVFVDLINQEYKENSEIEGKVFALISEESYLEVGDRKLEVVQALPSWISRVFIYCKNRKIPILSQILDYRNLIFFYPILMRNLSKKIRKFGPEKVVISSFAVAKNISLGGTDKPWTKLYLHSPIQYVWSHHDEYTQKIRGWKGILFKFIVPILRRWDKKFIEFDECYANSKYTANLAKEIYDMDCQIQYPKIEDNYLNTNISVEILPYFVYVGRLVNFVKECDLIIRLFNDVGIPLIMIGSGPDEIYLKSIAKENIMFVGRNPSGMIDIIRKAKGSINLTKESFGMGTAESLLLGVPVLGYNQGGSVELVDEGSGILVNDKNIDTLKKALMEFNKRNRDRRKVAENIRKKLNLNF